MSITALILIILLVVLIGGWAPLGTWTGGPYVGGGLGLVLVVLLILLLLGYLG